MNSEKKQGVTTAALTDTSPSGGVKEYLFVERRYLEREFWLVLLPEDVPSGCSRSQAAPLSLTRSWTDWREFVFLRRCQSYADGS